MNAISPPRHARDDGGDAWRHVGEVIDGSNQVRVVGLRSVAFHLSRASEGEDCKALAGFREADKIRRQLGCSWPNLITGDRKAGTP